MIIIHYRKKCQSNTEKQTIFYKINALDYGQAFKLESLPD